MIADEIAVMDRPSVTFGDWGTVGSGSPLRPLIPTFAETPVKLVAYSPPSGPVTELYQRYIQADLGNAEFKTNLLEGLAKEETFAGKLVQMEGQYSSGRRVLRGRDLLKELVSDAALSAAPLDERHQPGELFNVEDERARRATLRIIAIEASINLTNAMVVANKTGHLPVTDDPRGGVAQVSPDGLPVQAQLASDLGDRAAQGTELVDHEVVLLSNHGSSSAGSRRLLLGRNVTESSGARHLFAGEFSIATSGEFTIGSDRPAWAFRGRRARWRGGRRWRGRVTPAARRSRWTVTRLTGRPSAWSLSVRWVVFRPAYLPRASVRICSRRAAGRRRPSWRSRASSHQTCRSLRRRLAAAWAPVMRPSRTRRSV
jgi:hypothetical protein